MESLKSRYGSWCLVAGAAEGLGSAFSHALAGRGMNLIMVDWQEDRLHSLARQVKSSYGNQVLTLHLDLASADAVEVMMEAIRETSCRLVFYIAAFSRVQKFLEHDPAMLERYVEVNISTPMLLIHAFCQLHSGQKLHRKGLLLMSSLAGSWGTRLLAPYGGSKAFNHILAEALHYELKEDGFDVLACIAGATATPAYLASLPPGKRRPGSAMKPDRVVEAAINALGHRPFVVPGFKNKWIYFLMTRILPRRSSLRVMNQAVGKLYQLKE